MSTTRGSSSDSGASAPLDLEGSADSPPRPPAGGAAEDAQAAAPGPARPAPAKGRARLVRQPRYKPPQFRRRAAAPKADVAAEHPPVERSIWRRMVRLHRRLAAGIVVAALAYLLTPSIPFPTRFLVAWDLGTGVWMVLVLMLVAGGTAERVRRRAAEEDEGAAVILIAALLASLFSLVAVIQEAGSASGGGAAALPHLLLAVGTLTLSWAFMHGIYAMHYAREYYSVNADTHPMLGFPGDADPDFWDFFYFSFTIGTSAQTADVSVNSQRLRRIVLGQQIVAYVFNASVIATGVNIAASLV